MVSKHSYLPLLALAALTLIVSACAPMPSDYNESNATPPNGSAIFPLNGANGEVPVTPITPTQPSQPTPRVDENEFAARLSYTEGELITLRTQASSPDGVPVTLNFGSPFNREGRWQTQVGDAGDYPVIVTARDSRGLETTEKILLTIKYANRAPVIIGPDSITVKEGETITLRYTATDPDEGDQVVVSFSGWMKEDTYTTTFDDAGEYSVTVTASDGHLTTRKVVPIIVENVNRAPLLVLREEEISGTELQSIKIDTYVSDPDGDEVSLSFSSPFDGTGRWTPAYDDAGEYTVTVTATDSEGAKSTETVRVIVSTANRPPSINVPGTSSTLRFKEGDFINLASAVSVSDPEGDEIIVRYSGWMTSSTYQTNYDDAGTHNVVITATDENGLTSTAEITIIVDDVNRPPVFDRLV